MPTCLHVQAADATLLSQTTSFPGSLFSSSLSRLNRDPGSGWSHDHLSIQSRRVSGYPSTFDREDDRLPHPSSRFFYHPDLGGHVTSCSQSLSSLPPLVVGRETLVAARQLVAAGISVPTTKGGGEDGSNERTRRLQWIDRHQIGCSILAITSCS